MTTLGELLDRAGIAAGLRGGSRTLEVTSVELDSRRCGPGSLFVAMPGTRTTGVAFVADAVARGAACVVASTEVDAPVRVVTDTSSMRSVLARLSSAVVGDPKDELTLAGVTGTNGKTTVAWLLDGILTDAGYTSTTIGTITNERTTPAPPELHRLFREVADRAMAEGRSGAVALEVSSHALDQGRVEGVCFDVAVFTNLSHEHLDYHGTMERYFEAKALMFRPGVARAGVVCIDSPFGQRLAQQAEVPLTTVSTSDARVLDARVGRTVLEWRGMRVETRLTGTLNVPNAMLAIAAAGALGIDERVAAGSLETFGGVPGRLELVGDAPVAVLVDYAHTPEALERVLTDLRELGHGGRLLCVFGCGGDRDAAKRPLMGRIASILADEVIVTSDNPRSEDPEAIIDAIVAGAEGHAKLRRDPDRASAIATAIAAADAGDVVLIAGKGPETTQVFATRTVPFDDRAVAAAALETRSHPC